MLSEATAWYADGTFRTAAKFFAQLYVIMADHPDIDKCTCLLKVYENTSNNAYINAKKHNARGPKTNLPDVLREFRLRVYQRVHRKWILTNGRVGSSLATYKEDVLYHYAYTPPTASAGRQLYETDDSDHESDSDNNDDNELPSLDEDGPEEVGLPSCCNSSIR
jgi:hypothetical protein